MSRVRKLTIEGFKSIRKLEDFELRPLNVLIGANGAGKSNLVGFFGLVKDLIEQRLKGAVNQGGGADAFLHLGPKLTPRLRADILLEDWRYDFELAPTVDNRFAFTDEGVTWRDSPRESLGSGHSEALLKESENESNHPGWRHGRYGRSHKAHPAHDAISHWAVYHFHDTSATADVRRQRAINDNERLRADAANLAAFLFRLQQASFYGPSRNYERIRDVVRLAAPFFDDFKLRPIPYNSERIQLEWTQQGTDYPFRPSQLSDGTLRFICLATALLQPDPPATMLFDEPELGLHPHALTLLAELFREAAANGAQVVVSTQSVPLLNEFDPEDVIVVDREDGASTFDRLDAARLGEWLDQYSLGELWQKNVLGGHPRREPRPQPTAQPGD